MSDQPNYPQPQYPYQQPQSTPPPPPPFDPGWSDHPGPKKRGKGKFFAIGCGALAALVVLIAVIAIAASSGGKSSTNTPAPAISNTQATQQPTAKPTRAATPVIGKAWKVNDTWTVTVNQVLTSRGDQYTAPAPGKTYLVVDVTLLNTSNQTQHASGLIQWKLLDPSGQTYSDTLLVGTDPGGTVIAGGKIRGQIAYEVPLSIHTYTLQFTPDFGNDVAQWTVKI